MLGRQGHVWSCPRQVYLFPWLSDASLASTWLQVSFGSCRVWSVLVRGPCCQHFKMAQFGPVLHFLPQGSCVFPASCACLGQASPVPPDTQSPQERTARNTEKPPPPQCPSLRAHPLRGLSKQLIKHHVLSLLCCFLQIITHC